MHASTRSAAERKNVNFKNRKYVRIHARIVRDECNNINTDVRFNSQNIINIFIFFCPNVKPRRYDRIYYIIIRILVYTFYACKTVPARTRVAYSDNFRETYLYAFCDARVNAIHENVKSRKNLSGF